MHFKFSSKLQRLLEPDDISHSQILRRLKDFPVTAIEEVFTVVLRALIQKDHAKNFNPLQKLNIIDASTITKSQKGME